MSDLTPEQKADISGIIGEYDFRLEDAAHDQGFLEFRVRPVFNLMSLGLGGESRDLGIQLSGDGI
jgi:hypothetical protein